MATYAFVLPELGEGIEAGDVVNVLVAVGDVVGQDQPVLELETDKAVIEVPAPVNGTIQTLHVQAGETVSVGQLIVTFETAAVAPSPPTPVAVAADPPAALLEREPDVAVSEGGRAPQPVTAAPPPPQPLPSNNVSAAASPSVRRLAREVGVDINEVAGTGPGGRISVEDVKQHARRLLTDTGACRTAAEPHPPPLPDFTRWGEVERQPMSKVRRATADHMAQAWATMPHVTQHAKADITLLDQLRQRFAARAEAAGGKLTVTAIMLKVVATALKVFPHFNASVDLANHDIIFKRYYHIGVAVDTDRGLLVPVIRDVDQKNVLQLSVELTQLAEKARQRKTTLSEMQGGTFTVTNLGGIGGSHFSPIINPPEVAILGLARSAVEPVYVDGQFVPRLLLPLSLSYDHRVIDGADGARFMRWIVEALEQPFLLTLEG